MGAPSGFDVGTWLEIEELVKRQRGKVSPDSALDIREQAERYLEAMGGDAARRQVLAQREELDDRKRLRRDVPA